ncbi:MAG: YihY/virulence factor BrkB family protein [Syntrophobacteria bacterium]
MPAGVRRFLSTRLWVIDTDSLPRIQAEVYRQLQICIYVWKEFWRDNCLLRASALTYTTLLTLVPLLALMFALLKGLGVQRTLEPFILERLTVGSHALTDKILVFVERIHAGSLGTLGITFLFVTMVLVLTNVEMAFNRIWKVERGRPWLRKFSEYLGLLVILPVSIFAAVSLTTFVKNHAVTQELLSIGFFGRFYVYLLKLAPFFVMWLAFSFIYLFMPNTRVNALSASAGGIIGGTLWQMAQWAYIHYQFGFHKWSAIYGTLSQLPVFLIWIFVSWVILLLGAEIAFAHQNLSTYRLERRWRTQTVRDRNYWGLRLLLFIGERFESGARPCAVSEIAEHLCLPPEETGKILKALKALGVLSFSGSNSQVVLPAIHMKHMHIFDLVEGLEGRESTVDPTATDGYSRVIADVLHSIRDEGRKGVVHVTVADLLDRSRKEYR